MKLRYMKDKIKKYLKYKIRNFNSVFICLLDFMLNIKIYSRHEYKNTNKN